MKLRDVVVEDDTSAFPYNLLKGYGNTLAGCNGNKRLLEYVQNNALEYTLVYVDVNHDNYRTVHLYKQISEEASKRESVYVVPIPCMEYFFSRAFLSSDETSIRTALEFGDYR